jgi:hypothetical protein
MKFFLDDEFRSPWIWDSSVNSTRKRESSAIVRKRKFPWEEHGCESRGDCPNLGRIPTVERTLSDWTVLTDVEKAVGSRGWFCFPMSKNVNEPVNSLFLDRVSIVCGFKEDAPGVRTALPSFR